jgi:hypothetical protein
MSSIALCSWKMRLFRRCVVSHSHGTATKQ